MKKIRTCFIILFVISLASSTSTFRFHFFTPQYVKVFLKDDATIIGRYYTFVPKRGGKEVTILKLNRTGRSIRPDETDSIMVDFLVGKPFKNNTCWLFKVIDGDLCAYSTRPERMTNRITHIQKNGGAVVPFKRAVLKKYISDKPKVLRLFKEIFDKTEKRVQTQGAREAILEYNFDLASKEKKLNKLIKEMDNAKDITGKANFARSIISLDSTNYRAYEILGDYEITINNNEEKAYFYYTNMIRYCPRKYPKRSLIDKIKNLNREVKY